MVKTHWWQNCKYVSNQVTDINLIKMHIGYIIDFWWVRKPNDLHACSDSKIKEILQDLIFFASKSTEKHKAVIRIVKTILDNSRKTFLNKVFQKKIFSSLRKLTDSHFECKYFFCKSCSLLQILCFGTIHIVMNEKGDSFIRIHYGPFLSGNQKQNSGVWIIESNHHYREERCC